MSNKLTKGLVVLAALLLIAPVAFAQTTGDIEVKVVDESDAVLPGVTMTLSSAALQGERSQVSDGNGKGRFPGLAPGVYTIKAELDGFSPLEQQNITVKLDRTTAIILQLTSGFGEEITVTSATPVINSRSTTAGATFSDTLIQDLPVSRDFQGLAFAAPGVVTGGLGSNPSIGGASAAENRYVVDGLDTTDPAFGTIGTEVPFDFIKEVDVKTGGYEAEYGGALGGVLNVITKSGGNDLTYDLFGFWSDDSLQSEVPPTAEFGRDIGFTEYDFGAALGGKIIEDKLWYFIAANPATEEENYTTRGDIVTNTETTEHTFYAGKLTWQLDPNHQLVFSLFGDPTTQDNDLVRNSYGRLGTNDEFGADNFGITYNGVLSPSTFLEASVGAYSEDVVSVPLQDNPRYDVRSSAIYTLFPELATCGNLDPFTGANFSNHSTALGCLGATFAVEDNSRGRDEARGAFTWFGTTGNIDHELKFGGNIREVDYTDDARYPGPSSGAFFDSNGGSDADFTGTKVGVPVDATGLRGQRWLLFSSFALLLEYQQQSSGVTDEQAIFLQDQIRFNDYFSLNLGVRMDSFTSEGGGIDPITGMFINTSAMFPGRSLDFGFGDMTAPRIGFTWDVARNGKSKLYGHFGQFFESVPLDINARAFGVEIFNFFYFFYPSDGSLPDASNPGTHFYSYPLGTGVGTSADIKPMFTEESILGFEYEAFPNTAIGVKFTDRSVNDVIEDISLDGGHTYFITNPGGCFNNNPVTGELLTVDDFGNPLPPEGVCFPEATRDYEAFELSLNKRFSNNWQLYATYVNSENVGNYGGLFRQDNGQLDPNITSLFDLPSLLEGAFGNLPNDREHQFKTYGSYLWGSKLTTGFFFEFLSGTPISQLGGHPIYGSDERFVTPRGSFGTTSDTWHLDIHVEYPISFANGVDLKLIGDIFNVTDEQNVATVDQTWTNARLVGGNLGDCGGPGTGTGTACPAGNPLFGQPTAYQDPQTVRLGIKLSK